MQFRIIKKSKKSSARAGVITTAHGEIHTPAFVPVGTQATVKTLTPDELKSIGVEIFLANTYHLYLRPGDELIKKIGGLHKFMNWSGPLMTDSGGYQVFSLGYGALRGVGKIVKTFPKDGQFVIGSSERLKKLLKGEAPHLHASEGANLVKINEDGATFKSHLDGSLHCITPEKSISIQQNLGADLIFAFDECTSPLASYEYTELAMERTHRWAVRCLKAKRKFLKGSDPMQALFGIVQGGEYQNLREESAKFIASQPFDGFGIGGSLGKSKKDMLKILKWVVPFLPEEKPRHLLGIGHGEDFLGCIKTGMDLFDCVQPMRLARNGTLLTHANSAKSLASLETLCERAHANNLIKSGRINISNRKFRLVKAPPEKNCSCYTCKNFSLAYLNHLFRAGEMLGPRLATIHNLYFTVNLVKNIRQGILAGKV